MKNHDLCGSTATIDYNVLLRVAEFARSAAAQRLRDALDEVAPQGIHRKGTPEEVYRKGIRDCIVAESMKWDTERFIEANETVHLLSAMFNRPETKWKNHPHQS